MVERNKSVLIVDDNEDVRDFLDVLLATDGYQTYCAASGMEALELANMKRPDLILLDIMMPEMDGYEVCERLESKPDTRDIPVVMVTDKNDIASISRSLNAGARGFIVKPFDSDCLLQAVQMILTNRPFDFYNALTPIVSNSAPPEPLSPTEQLAFLLVLEPAGRKSIFLHAAETPGNKLLALWQEPQDEGCVQSTAACLTASSAQFDVLLGVIADRPTVKILNCQVYDGAIVPR